MTVADNLRKICARARQPIEAMLDAAEELQEIREAASAQGLDWSQVKALLKAPIQDERDGGDRVKKLVAKAANASTYAAMLGIVAENQKTPPQSSEASAGPQAEAVPPTRGGETSSDAVVTAESGQLDIPDCLRRDETNWSPILGARS